MAIIHRDPLEEITRWEPFLHWEAFRGVESLQREINRLFERVAPGGNGEIRSLTFMPSAELEETDNEIHLKLEVPGMEAKDLNVEVKTEEKGIVRSEFHYGKFERRIPLPSHVQTDKVQAECKNGMLKLTLPKVESEKRKAVKVDIS
jgi:HSP20 family protein